jgi:alpha-tubulin suppressor-like RCC1 family protein
LSVPAARLVYLGALLVLSCSRVSNVLTLPSGSPLDAGAGGVAGGSAPDAATTAGTNAGADAAPDAQPLEAGTLTTSSLAAGIDHNCAALNGALYCWGDNTDGQLGLGDTNSRNVPTRVGALGDWKLVACGDSHSCAVRSDGTAYCFGGNSIGQLGTSSMDSSLVPVKVESSAVVTDIVTEVNHVCVIGSDGALVCWGENLEGEIGQNDPPNPMFISSFAPIEVGTDRDWSAVATGQGDTCGVRGGGNLYCWGRNSSSQLGLGDGAPQQTRTPTAVGTTLYSHVAAGQDHSCAIRTDGVLFCWGLNTYGFLGTGDRVTQTSPTQVGAKVDWVQIALDVFHTCAIDSSQHLFCWGRNLEGQLGVGDNDDRLSPAQVTGEGFVQVAVGRFHTCVLKADDSVWCTGIADAGVLGLGDNNRRNTFTELTFP